MKKYLSSALSLILIMLSSCIGHDYSLCGMDDNCVLQLGLTNSNGEDILGKEIHKLDVIVFDRHNNFVLHHVAEGEEFTETGEIKLTVDPGYYRIVCWGNMSDNSQLSDFNEYPMFDNGYVEVVSDETSCPLYYGRPEVATKAALRTADYEAFEVHVPGNKVISTPLELKRAYRSISVYVKGLEHLASGYDGSMPVIEAANFPSRYNFFLQVDESVKDYRMQTVNQSVENVGEMPYASINTPISDINENMVVNVRNGSDDVLIQAISLKEYVDSHEIEDDNEIEILVRISANADVSITIPNWDEFEVKPI